MKSGFRLSPAPRFLEPLLENIVTALLWVLGAVFFQSLSYFTHKEGFNNVLGYKDDVGERGSDLEIICNSFRKISGHRRHLADQHFQRQN